MDQLRQSPSPATHPDHLALLPGGAWGLWRCLALRGAGFAAERVLALAHPPLETFLLRLFEAEDARDQARRRVLAAINGALDGLRAAGEWDRGDVKKPLLKALRATARGAVPRPWNRAAESLVDGLQATEVCVRSSAAALARAHAAAVVHASREIEGVAAWNPFREAVAWQNRQAVATACDPLLRSAGKERRRRSQRRQHEALVVSYLQRYATKNDTIGFFGPVGWGELAPTGPPVELRPGAGLLARREVYFENWTVAALADALERKLDLRPYLCPRLRSSCWRDGGTVHTAFAEVELTAEQARVLDGCDGTTPACRLAAGLVEEEQGTAPSTAEAVFEILDNLVRRRVLVWELGVALELHPERTLRRELARIENGAVRASALATLERLDVARRQVARAAGDSGDLCRSMERLEEVFTDLTGREGHRHHGQTYAARGLVYEDCRRDLKARFGPECVDRLGSPLNLVLRAMRWLVGELTRVVDERLLELHEGFRRVARTEVGSYPFFGYALSALFLGKSRDGCFDHVEREFQRRWAELLALPAQTDGTRLEYSCAALARRAPALFPSGGPSWSVANQLSPDVLIAADGEEAFRAGDFTLVLGEIHPSNTYLASCFVSQHPSPEDLQGALESDVGGRLVVFPQMLKENWTQRMTPGLFPRDAYQFEFAHVDAASRPCRGLPAGSLVIEVEKSRVVARARDGSLSFGAVELFSSYLNQVCSSIAGRLLPPAEHTPRIAVDDVVICRETWRFGVSELDFLSHRDELNRYVGVRRWARSHGLPRHCFYRVSSERKPVFLDLQVPALIELFVHQLRGEERAKREGRLVVSEMLPRPDQLWLRDAEGRRYTSELRLVALQVEEESAAE